MKYDIWTEGFQGSGDRGYAHPLAFGVEAPSFIEAVQKWWDALKSVSNPKKLYGEITIKNGTASIWGCKLFDNEQDARKSFG